MGKRLATVVGLLWALGGCDCSSSELASEPERETPVPPDEDTTDENPHPEEPQGEPPLATVVSGWDRGREVETEVLEVAADAEPLVLDLRGGGRITLDPGTRAALGEEAPAQVYLAQGALHAQLPPMGGSSRPTLRLGTPAGTLALEGSGETYLVVAPDGRVLYAQLAGLGRVYDGELDDAGRPLVIPLRPGRSLVGGASDATEGVGQVGAARALRGGFEEAGEQSPPEGTLEPRIEWLNTFAESVAEERTRGQEIQRQRVLASRDGNEERGAELQRELIAHSQVVSRQRAALRARWERARSLALLTEAEPDPSEAVRGRVRVLLGLEIPSAEPDASDTESDAAEPTPAQN